MLNRILEWFGLCRIRPRLDRTVINPGPESISLKGRVVSQYSTVDKLTRVDIEVPGAWIPDFKIEVEPGLAVHLPVGRRITIRFVLED